MSSVSQHSGQRSDSPVYQAATAVPLRTGSLQNLEIDLAPDVNIYERTTYLTPNVAYSWYGVVENLSYAKGAVHRSRFGQLGNGLQTQGRSTIRA